MSNRPRAIRPIAYAVVCLTLGTAALSAQMGRNRNVAAPAGDTAGAGQYRERIDSLTRIAPSDSEWLSAQRELVRALATVGRYDDAERAGRRAAAGARGASVETALGEVLMARGKDAGADSAFSRAIASRASDSLAASLDLAIVHYRRGDRDRAHNEFDHFIDVYNSGHAQTSEDLVAVARAVEYLGADNPQLFKDALKAYDQAIAADQNNLDARIRLADLFLSKYQSGEAQSTLDPVLIANPYEPSALLSEAKLLAFDGKPGADSLLEHSLALNPNYVDALVFMADGYIEHEDYAAAQQALDRAFSVNPNDPSALAVAAAVRYVQHDSAGFERYRRQALALDPHDGDFYGTLAELTENLRLYKEAAAFAEQGIQADRKNWRAWGLLGMNEMRIGQIEEGRKSLDSAFAGDPYNVWIKNTLDLLDTYKNYDLISTQHFDFLIEKDEAPLLRVYLEPLAERAYATFAARYGYTPPGKVRIELYRSHADFAVRTVGLGAIDAVGVSFGTVLAFDSPVAKEALPPASGMAQAADPDAFNWGSTMWHELAHTFTLGLSEHRVPRWFSEGLSVYEEHHAMPGGGWGFNVSPQFLSAFRQGKLVPVSRMNDGFMHPAYPEQVQFSYYQASLVCELIARDWGDSTLVKMLHGYRDGLTTDEVFQKTLSTSLKDFDKRFDDYLRARYGRALAAISTDTTFDAGALAEASADELIARARADSNDLRVQLIAGRSLMEKNQGDAAMAALGRAAALFPDNGGASSPYPLMIEYFEEKGDTAAAASLLTTYARLTEANYNVWTELSALREALHDWQGAADALDRALYVNPFDLEVHQHLADLYSRLNDRPHAVRERQAVVAMHPVDMAAAQYQLAVAYHDAGDLPHARTAVLRALEDAPNYEPAQTLLLTIHDERGKQSGGAKP